MLINDMVAKLTSALVYLHAMDRGIMVHAFGGWEHFLEYPFRKAHLHTSLNLGEARAALASSELEYLDHRD
jgi:hypothetical protein